MSAVKEDDRTRHYTSNLFTPMHSLTGETRDLSWLYYSESTGKEYCFPCKLLSANESVFTTGFNNWRSTDMNEFIHIANQNNITPL